MAWMRGQLKEAAMKKGREKVTGPGNERVHCWKTALGGQ